MGLSQKLEGLTVARNVTTDDLRGSQLPNSSVSTIIAEFKSDRGFSYRAVHVFDSPDGSYILLSGLDKDEIDFYSVEQTIVKEIAGMDDKRFVLSKILRSKKIQTDPDVTDRGSDISTVIMPIHRFTQERVADLIDGYKKHFKSVSIPEAHFEGLKITA